MLEKNWVGLLSIALTVAVTVPYVGRVLQGKIKPHIFTWIIWSLTTSIAGAARMVAHAGPGAWAQWASVASCLSVVCFSFSKGEHNITRSDVVAFASALLAIPVWMLTKNPLSAVAIVTCIDVIGYYPTFRKTYNRPYDEAMFNYVVANILHVLSLLATVDYSLTTLLFPSVLFFANASLVGFLWWRRRVVVVV